MINKGVWAFLIILRVVVAWHSSGHMIINAIAQIELDQEFPGLVEKIEGFLSVVKPFSHEEKHLFVEQSEWADDIKGINWKAFNAWHYKDIPYFPEPDFRPEVKEDDVNAVWAVGECMRTLYSNWLPKTGNYIDASMAKSFMMRYLTHLIGDLH